MERHPDLFEQAKAYEKIDSETGKRYTWIENESLEELSRPDRVAAIKAQYQKQKELEKECTSHLNLKDVFRVEKQQTFCEIKTDL